MLGDTISLTIGGSAKVLSKINQDQNSSEYFLKGATGEYRLRVKHSKDRVTSGAPQRDRHVMTLTETVYPTPTSFTLTRVSQFSFVGEYLDDAGVQADNLVGLTAWANKPNVVKLAGWEV